VYMMHKYHCSTALTVQYNAMASDARVVVRTCKFIRVSRVWVRVRYNIILTLHNCTPYTILTLYNTLYRQCGAVFLYAHLEWHCGTAESICYSLYPHSFYLALVPRLDLQTTGVRQTGDIYSDLMMSCLRPEATNVIH